MVFHNPCIDVQGCGTGAQNKQTLSHLDPFELYLYTRGQGYRSFQGLLRGQGPGLQTYLDVG